LLRTVDSNSACGSNSALWVAANNARNSIGLLLIAHGARPSSDDPLGIALSRRGTETLALALIPLTPPQTGKTSEWYNALHDAARSGNLVVVQHMVQAGWEQNVLAGRGRLETPLGLAVKMRHHDVVRFLLNNGADARLTGSSAPTPMALAIRNDDTTAIRLLVVEGRVCVGFGTLMESGARGTKETTAFLEELLRSGVARKC
jgi:ankyrin repeat protein